LVGLGSELRTELAKQALYSVTWTIPPGHFALIILKMEVSQTVCLGWLLTVILPIWASQVDRITGMSHWCQTVIWTF
jgi:hypothetical protein